MKVLYNDMVQSLPPVSEETLLPQIKAALEKSGKTIVVLDDDPTGTQTVHDVLVLTVWDVESIADEIKRGSLLFFILTNSRSMKAAEADALTLAIGKNIKEAFARCNKQYGIVSRSDSTLRGHFPNEVQALAQGLGLTDFQTVLIPAFFEGGRITVNDVHYVKEGAGLTPVAETDFAKDKAFGFSQSDLKKWVEEKTKSGTKASDVVSFSIEELRKNSVEELAEKTESLPAEATVVVNAAAYADLEKFAAACWKSDKPMLFRTAASFVKALAGIESIPLLQKDVLINSEQKTGGLIVIGSYVEKTTKQLTALLKRHSPETIELPIEAIIAHDNCDYFKTTFKQLNSCLYLGIDVVLFTSRQLFVSEEEGDNLSVNNKVSHFISNLVASLTVVPKYIVAKGGITSSDLATKALGIKRATVMGQALPGVPVWRTGIESKFPEMSYVIFPGNVGDNDALAELYEKLI